MSTENPGDDAPLTEATEATTAPAADALQVSSPDTGPDSAPSTPDAAEQLGAKFRLADVPEDYRDHVERYVKQAQGAFTQKTQELAAQRKQVERQLALDAQLRDPDSQYEALRALNQEYRLGLEFEDDVDEPDPAQLDEEGEIPPHLLARIEAVEQAEAQRTAEQQTQAQQAYAQAVHAKIDAGLAGWAKKNRLDEVPDYVRSQVHGILVSGQVAPLDDDMPDVDAALSIYDAHEAAQMQAYFERKRNTPTVEKTGDANVTEKPDLSDRKARLRAAEAIAGRHL